MKPTEIAQTLKKMAAQKIDAKELRRLAQTLKGKKAQQENMGAKLEKLAAQLLKDPNPSRIKLASDLEEIADEAEGLNNPWGKTAEG